MKIKFRNCIFYFFPYRDGEGDELKKCISKELVMKKFLRRERASFCPKLHLSTQMAKSALERQVNLRHMCLHVNDQVNSILIAFHRSCSLKGLHRPTLDQTP